MTAKRINLVIDGQQVEANEGDRLIDVAKQIGVDIPRFCYHPDLSVVASCRMCLVDVEGSKKPLPSCATNVAEGMVVKTATKKAVDAQKSVMRFLLMKHPLHCPICDQGGQCELQDVAMGYGDGITDYAESKRDIDDEDLGALVATDMSLCIHCTRCVRFGDEIAGIKELGLIGRSDDAKISTYLSEGLKSEWSGNMIDLCPVGALTSKVAKFSGRSWSYRSHPSIATHDCLGAHIEVHTSYKGYGGIHEVKAIAPRQSVLNHIWLSDRDRFSYEAFNKNRVSHPLQKVGDQWVEISYEDALNRVSEAIGRLSPSEKERSLVSLSPQTTTEAGCAIARYFRSVGIHHIDIAAHEALYSEDLAYHPATAEPDDIEQADTILLVGCALRWDVPNLSLRVKKAQERGAKVLSMGSIQHHYPYVVDHHMVNRVDFVRQAMILLKAWHQCDRIPSMWQNALSQERVVVLLGEEALTHPDSIKLNQALVYHAQQHSYQYALLPQGPNQFGLYQAGCMPFVKGCQGKRWQEVAKNYIDFLWLEQVDPVKDLGLDLKALQSTFVVACVSHLTPDIDATADIILPHSLPMEQTGSYQNYYGLQQKFTQVVKPQGFMSTQEIFASLSQKVDIVISHQQVLEKIHQDKVKQPEVVPALDDCLQILRLQHWVDTDIVLRHAQSLQTAYPISNAALVHPDSTQSSNTPYLMTEDVAKDTMVVYRNSKAHAMINQASNKREDGC
ncbi:NADH-quinone oxidoreductase subunit NuoG [Gammaproteobacteria bacterium]|nr:NADH-quinone oxidoreductase subunit NuoG [Gammaproteobacteria bacterium]